MRTPRALYTFLAAVTVLAISVLATPATAGQQGLLEEARVEYSAESIIDSEGGSSIFHRVFHSKGRERREQSIGGMAQVIIIRQDREIVWILMPALMIYLEQPLGASMEQIGFQNGMDVTKKTLGSEIIDGHRTTKRAVTATKKGVPGFEGTTWTTDDGIMVRVEGKTINNGHKSWFRMRLTDIKTGRQDPALFELPEGYRRMQLPAAIGAMGPAPPKRPAR